MSKFVYTNILKYSFKMWGYDLFVSDDGSAEVIVYWGRIGLPMDRLFKKRKYFQTHNEAYLYIKERLIAKKSKGYKAIENYKYFDAILNGEPLSILIFKIETESEEIKWLY